MNTLFYLGIIFVLGAFTEWLSPKLHLSKVVGYMIIGLLIAPGTFGLIPHSFVQNVHILIDLALSLIAVLVGANLKYSTLKGMTKKIISITFFEALFAFLIVTIGFFFLSHLLFHSFVESLAIALLLGGIASATAPASTLALIYELKAHGRFSIILLSVVALDDAMALILFAFALTIAEATRSSGGVNFSAIMEALIMIFGSIGIGFIAGVVTTWLEKLFSHHKGMETIATLGMIFIAYSTAHALSLEPILTALVMGAVLSNLSKDFDLVEEEVDNHIVEVVFMLFFILSAMHLNLSALLSLPIAIIAYIILRLGGKVIGVYVGAKLSHAGHDVERYLGIALFPQAGVAIGLALSIQDNSNLLTIAPIILNIIIATTVVHELLGPFFTKYALEHSQDKEN